MRCEYSRICSVILLGISLLNEISFAQSVEDLLNEADRALNQGETAPKNSSKVEIRHDEKSAKLKKAPATPKADESVGAAVPTKLHIEPGSLQEILNIDQEYRKRALLRKEDASVAFSIGMSYLNHAAGYRLKKDEDDFEYVDPSSAVGLQLAVTAESASSHLPIAWLYGANVAFFNNSSEVERRGVENERSRYDYFIVPAMAFVGVGKKLFDRMAVEALLGVGAELIDQRGRSDSDSVTTIKAGPALAVGVSYRIGKSWDVLARYQKHGLGSRSQGSSLASSQAIVGMQWNIAM